MSRAVLAFRRAGFAQGEQEAAHLLDRLRVTRTCWVCGREMQGQGIHFDFLPTTIQPYELEVLSKARQDLSSVLPDDSKVAVCVVCRDLITNQAQRIADEKVQKLVNETIAPLVQTVNQMNARMINLERNAHEH